MALTTSIVVFGRRRRRQGSKLFAEVAARILWAREAPVRPRDVAAQFAEVEKDAFVAEFTSNGVVEPVANTKFGAVYLLSVWEPEVTADITFITI